MLLPMSVPHPVGPSRAWQPYTTAQHQRVPYQRDFTISHTMTSYPASHSDHLLLKKKMLMLFIQIISVYYMTLVRVNMTNHSDPEACVRGGALLLPTCCSAAKPHVPVYRHRSAEPHDNNPSTKSTLTVQTMPSLSHNFVLWAYIKNSITNWPADTLRPRLIN